MVRVDRIANAGHVCATSAAGRSHALVYSSHGFGFTVDMGALGGGQIACNWVDPRSGGETEVFCRPGRDFHSFQPPKTGEGYDWVLRLRAA